jgi:hypothetical protein
MQAAQQSATNAMPGLTTNQPVSEVRPMADTHFKPCINHPDRPAKGQAQGGRCAICLQEPAEGKSLHVDHCHVSGVVRGLLCHQCNWYLGKVDSVPGLLTRLVAYAQKERVAA